MFASSIIVMMTSLHLQTQSVSLSSYLALHAIIETVQVVNKCIERGEWPREPQLNTLRASFEPFIQSLQYDAKIICVCCACSPRSLMLPDHLTSVEPQAEKSYYQYKISIIGATIDFDKRISIVPVLILVEYPGDFGIVKKSLGIIVFTFHFK